MEKCAGSIIVNDGKVLLIKQTEGHWGFPKGHMEENETEVMTALREVKEETNLDICIDESKRYVNTYIMPNNIQKTVVYFVGHLPNNNEIKLQESEVLYYSWVDIDDVHNYFEYQNAIELWNKIKGDLRVK